MRLAAGEIAAIKAAANDVFGPDIVVRLFGSRLDDSRRGGDIDLHFERIGGRPDARTASRFRTQLTRSIGERAIDLVFHDPAMPMRPIDQIAITQGIVL